MDHLSLALYRMSERFAAGNDAAVRESLERLHPGEDSRILRQKYYVGKIRKSLLILLAGFLLAGLMHYRAGQSRILRGEDLMREDFSGRAKELVLQSESEAGSQQIELTIYPRELSEQEILKWYRKMRSDLPGLILAENPSLLEVNRPLLLEEEYEGYPFEVDWRSSDPETVSPVSGTVSIVREAKDVTLTAKLSCGDFRRTEEVPLRVIPPELTPEEWYRMDLWEEVRSAESGSREEGEVNLPEVLDGKEISWSKQGRDRSGMALFGSLFLAVLVYLLADHDLQQEMEQRRERMRRRYPEVVQLLTLYMGAGLSARPALRRISEDYQKRRKNGAPEDPIYEEITATCHELSLGTSEGDCYERLGKRTGLQEYIRLCALLTQNLSKGDRMLLVRLREETAAASRLRVQNCKRAGEEAGTKLLLPMVLLLLVVMIMIMVPAFSAQGF